MPPTAFAVDDERLVGASFRREADGLELVERHAVALPESAFAGGSLGGAITDLAALAGAIEELVGRFSHRPRRASLVLPDAWARGVIVELGSLPDRPATRVDVLRFRLRKLVPFRPEELRVAASPVASVSGQEDPVRALVLYASEAVCAALEESFAAARVHLGQIVGVSLAQLDGLVRGGQLAGWSAVATVERRGFTLVCTHDGEPVVWRQKSFEQGEPGEKRAPSLAAELRLTRTFLTERLGAPELTAVVLAGGDGPRAPWEEVLGEGLGRTPVAIGPEWLPLSAASAGEVGAALVPLVGAVCREVA